MASTVVDDGQVSTGAILNAGDTQSVQSSTQNITTGGKAYLTTININGSQTVTYGTTDHVTVNPGIYATENFGGVQTVSFGGVANNTILIGPNTASDSENFWNGRQTVSGGTANNTVVDGGHQAVYSQAQYDTSYNVIPGSIVEGHANASVLTNGGEQFVSYGGVATDTIIADGGRQILDGNNWSEQNDHLLPGGSITVSGLSFDASTSKILFDQTSGYLTVTEGSASATIHLAGNYADQTFVAEMSTAYFGTQVRLLCFARGTLITTSRGERLIEELEIGDRVVTSNGRQRPICWIGSTKAVVHRDSRPVIVRAGAFATGSPSRDLTVTPWHSFLFGDVLIPIISLINDASILFDDATKALELFHVELDRHDVLLANGSLAESYRDDGNGVGFTRQSGVKAKARSLPTCAPVVKHGAVVERVKRRLAERAERQSPTARGSELVSSSIS